MTVPESIVVLFLATMIGLQGWSLRTLISMHTATRLNRLRIEEMERKIEHLENYIERFCKRLCLPGQGTNNTNQT